MRRVYRQFFNEDGEIKFILVAHSMGGLVARYFVNVLQGGRDIQKLILMGVPVFGSVDALYGLREGEFPETFLGELLNLRFYSQGSTRTILFSMPSAFQLLPTYEASIAGKTLKELGLDIVAPLDLSSFEGGSENQIFRNYLNFKIIPGYFRFQKYYPIAETLYHHFAAKMLLAYLKSAQCFHRATDINRDRKTAVSDMTNCEEYERVAEAERFVKDTDETVKGIKISIAERVKTKGDPATEIATKVKTTITFSGHCQPTRTRARFDDENRTVVFETKSTTNKNDAASDLEELVEELGDGRVSIFSTGVHLPGQISDFYFIMCESHVGLVSNPAFQYNLIRELRIN